MRITAIVQARSGSTRLPDKVLADLCGRNTLERIVDRLRRCRRLDDVVVATTTDPADDRVAQVAARAGVACTRGSADDVLARYAAAACAARSDVVVRITGDCPLLQPDVVDAVVDALLEPGAGWDYASNVIERTYPRGFDVEALHADALHRVARLATGTAAREHVTWFILNQRPDLFARRSIRGSRDDADLRFTLDTATDLELIRLLYGDLAAGRVRDDGASLIAHVRGDTRLAALAAERR